MSQLEILELEVSYPVAGLIAVTVLGLIGSGFVVGNLGGMITILASLLRLAVSLFVVYLFYRFVIAVETIAEKH